MKALILSSSEGMSLGLMRCLSLHDVESHVMSIWKGSGAARFSRFCKSFSSYQAPETIQELEAFATFVEDYCKKINIDIVFPAGLLGTFVLSKLKGRLHYSKVYPTPDPEQIYFLHNKWLFHKYLEENCIPSPKTVLVEKEDQLDLPLTINFPLLLKPLTLGNGEGVQTVKSVEEAKNYIFRGDKSSNFPLLLQEYAPGSDIIFGLLANDGELIAWTMHERTPDLLRFFRNESILEFGRKIVALCNYTGVANFDVRFDQKSGSIKILECNPRFWASTESSVFYGVDFVKLGILLAQGEAKFEHLKTEVSNTYESPYHTPGKFLKGLMFRKYPLKLSKRNLALKALSDPLPSIVGKIGSRFNLTNLYDSEIIEKLTESSTW